MFWIIKSLQARPTKAMYKKTFTNRRKIYSMYRYVSSFGSRRFCPELAQWILPFAMHLLLGTQRLRCILTNFRLPGHQVIKFQKCIWITIFLSFRCLQQGIEQLHQATTRLEPLAIWINDWWKVNFRKWYTVRSIWFNRFSRYFSKVGTDPWLTVTINHYTLVIVWRLSFQFISSPLGPVTNESV